MMEIDKLLLNEIIRLKNINKSLGQKVKHYDEMLSLKVRLTMEQQKYLSSTGGATNKDMFNICSKDLLEHLEYLRDYESRSNVLNLARGLRALEKDGIEVLEKLEKK